MSWSRISVIFIKDLKEFKADKGLWVPIIIIAVAVAVFVPVTYLLASVLSGQPISEIKAFTRLSRASVENPPLALAVQLAGLNPIQRQIYLLVAFLMAPTFLFIPLIAANVLSADSFAGEKERKTIESLLYTPITDLELLLAKILAPFTVALLVAWGSFILYAITVNASAWPQFGRIFFPNWLWLILMIWVVPAVAFLAVGAVVLVSAKVRSFRGAQQIGGLVVLPLLVIIFLQAFGIVYFSAGFTFLFGLGFWALDGILLLFGAEIFEREEMIAKLG